MGFMFKKMVLALLCSVLGLGLIPGKAGAVSVPVDLELSLVVDVSGSIDSTDFNLQKSGYVNAFQSSQIINAIMAGGTYHAIAVNLVYFSDGAVQAVPWTLINDAASANAFATAVNNYTRPYSGGTGVVNAVNTAYPLFASNGFEGDRLVIDVSGDGSESNACSYYTFDCIALQNARDAALAAGITTINGLAIYDRSYYGAVGSGATIEAIPYLEHNLIGGTGAFAVAAATWEDFGAAVQNKLAREITPTPEPGILLLIGSGLLSIVGLRRKFKK